MRPDMGRLIIEVGRTGDGSSKSCYDKIRRVGEDFENLPSFESTSRHRKQDSKSQGDRLRPLWRYMDKQVGRPWSAVFSEICAVNDKRTIRGYHLLTHLFQEIWTNGIERKYGRIDNDDYFVDEAGILRKRPKKRFRWPIDDKPVELIKLGDGWRYEKLEGLWYRIHHRVDETVVPGHFVERTHSEGTKWEWKTRYWVNTTVTTNVVIDAKFSCGKKDLKKIRELLKQAA